jgi:hypothetical protein
MSQGQGHPDDGQIYNVAKGCPPIGIALLPLHPAPEWPHAESGLVESEPVAQTVTHAVSASTRNDSKPPFARTREYDVGRDREPESVRADKWDKNKDADDRSDRHH